ncbi:hypothetical protein SISNIDRAFT_489820 [Sistotremastrum niveocremeum HHB9708]|uniref:Uncharacterized protein n=1 Tax=Sistotremastrum niveocremeum HHB9708 TaxID=1314777 RepID=A0A164PJC5_9AGAM|nr:hypothetical protein SISNIDRAFT_489820 [Sistotremastrum niveocremeum HHB9708]
MPDAGLSETWIRPRVNLIVFLFSSRGIYECKAWPNKLKLILTPALDAYFSALLQLDHCLNYYCCGHQFPEKVVHGTHSFFCTINDKRFGDILTLEIMLIAAATLVCQGTPESSNYVPTQTKHFDDDEVALIIVVYKRRRACQKLGVPNSLDLSQIIRISVFNLWELVGLLLNSGAIGNVVGNTMIATFFLALVALGVVGDAVAGTAFATTFLAVVPLSVCIIFGARKDILTFWSIRLLRRIRSKELDKGSAQKSGSRSFKSVAPKARDKTTINEVETITLVASTV